MKNRNINIDAARGFGMIIVAFVHACINHGSYPGWALCGAAFIMPVFMFLSGFFSYSDKKKNDFTWIKGRAKLLLIPFLIWQVITMFSRFKFNISDSVNYFIAVLKEPDKSYWFLLILFELCLFLSLANYVIEKLKIEKFDFIIYLCIILFLNILVYKFRIVIFGIYLLAWYSFFFFFGYLSNKYKLNQKYESFLNNNIVKILGIIIAIIVVPMFRMFSTPIYEEMFNQIVANQGLQKIFMLFMKYFVALIGSYAYYTLISMLPMVINNKLAFLGGISIEIYILHRFFFFSFCENWFIDASLMTIGSIIVSTIIILIIEKGYLSELIFGRKMKSK